jgi:hypothetical protein
MARKSKKRAKPAVAPTPKSATPRRVVHGLILVGAFALGFAWWQDTQKEDSFLGLAAAGIPKLTMVKPQPNLGGGHLRPGQGHRYESRFPTSGIHAPDWTRPGIYDLPQPPIMLVHAQEHGHIVIYVDTPGEAVSATLRGWAELYGGAWQGIVITPMPGLGAKVVLNAWNQHLDLLPFDDTAAAAFIDRFRGRGPENPVR